MTKNQLTITAAAVVAALAAAYPASAWYFGKQIEAAHAEIDQQIAAVPYLKLVKHDYNRELFNATEVITLQIPAELFQPPKKPAEPVPGTEAEEDDEEAAVAEQQAPATPVTPPAPLPPIQITIKSDIQHGPFPGFSAFGAGSAKTVLVFDEAVQQKIATVFGGKAPVEIQTLYSVFGGGRATVTSPAFKVALPAAADGGQSTLSGDGLTATVDFAKGMESYTIKGDAPRFEATDDKGTKFVLAGIKIEGDEKRLFKDEPLLYAGTQRFTIAELLAESKAEGSTKVQIKDFVYDVSTPLAGEHLDLVAKIGTGDFRVGEQNFGPMHYDFSLKHLHGRKLAALHRSALAIYSKPGILEDQAQLQQSLGGLKTQVLDLVLENPEFTIDRLSIHTAQGDANLAARIKLAGVAAADFDNPMALIPKIDFGADISIAAALIAELQPGKAVSEEEIAARKQSTDQMIAAVVQQGFVTNEGGTLKTHLSFRGGQFLVNEKPFNPMGMMPHAEMK